MNRQLMTVTAGVMLLGMSACTAFDRAEATPTPSPSSEGEETCENEFYPTTKGANWSYTVNGGTSGSFTRTILDAAPTGFTDEDVFATGETHKRLWHCDDNALTITEPDEGATGPLDFYSRMHDFQTSMADGVTIPDGLMLGTLWNEELVLEGASLVNGHDVPAKDSIKFECNAVSTETVSVPAGTFQTVHGSCKFDEKLARMIGGAEQTEAIVTVSDVWYASGVGLVKSEQVAPDGQKTTVELSSYHLP